MTDKQFEKAKELREQIGQAKQMLEAIQRGNTLAVGSSNPGTQPGQTNAPFSNNTVGFSTGNMTVLSGKEHPVKEELRKVFNRATLDLEAAIKHLIYELQKEYNAL